MGSTRERVAARGRGRTEEAERVAKARIEHEQVARRFEAARAQRDAAEQVMAVSLSTLVGSLGSVEAAAERVDLGRDEAERLLAAVAVSTESGDDE
ncbi:MAG: hypothetical protein WBD41_06790 [Rhodococcus sp. (in: high G+C Gram-positive bacteria)]